MKCPVCNSILAFDEVDIGVGTQKGNYHCNYCGWVEKEALDKLFGSDRLSGSGSKAPNKIGNGKPERENC